MDDVIKVEKHQKRFTAAHPELEEALLKALRIVSEERPDDPVRRVAEILREVHGEHVAAEEAARAVAVAALEAKGEDTPFIADEESKRRRQAMRGRARRGSVFGESGNVDASWKPPVVPKSKEEEDECRRLLEGHVLFGAAVDEEQKGILAGAMESVSFPAGAKIVVQGEDGDYFYAVASGTCRVLVNGEEVVRVPTGGGFGELALLYNSPRAATVEAVEEVRTWRLDRKTFRSVLIASTRAKRERYAEFLGRVELLRALSERERLTIADAVAPVRVAAGEAVIVEGDENADRFFLVEEGELKGTKKDIAEEVCPRLGPGSYFGELALLDHAKPRAATITAVTDCKLLALDKAAFLRLLGPIEGMLRRQASRYGSFLEQAASRASLESFQDVIDEETED